MFVCPIQPTDYNQFHNLAAVIVGCFTSSMTQTSADQDFIEQCYKYRISLKSMPLFVPNSSHIFTFRNLLKLSASPKTILRTQRRIFVSHFLRTRKTKNPTRSEFMVVWWRLAQNLHVSDSLSHRRIHNTRFPVYLSTVTLICFVI